MTCKEKLEIEHPEQIISHCKGGCLGCPNDYGYMPEPEYCPEGSGKELECTECWKREIPGTEKPKNDIPWDKIRDVIEDGMAKGDREIHLYFNPETGFSMNLYPWPDPDALYEMYQKGQITQNDFREKMGLLRKERD